MKDGQKIEMENMIGTGGVFFSCGLKHRLNP